MTQDIADTLTLPPTPVDNCETILSDEHSYQRGRSRCSTCLDQVIELYDRASMGHTAASSFRTKQLKALSHCIELLTRRERPRVTSATGEDMEL
eukprot:164800-Hanusia_phi.AAC.1